MKRKIIFPSLLCFLLCGMANTLCFAEEILVNEVFEDYVTNENSGSLVAEGDECVRALETLSLIHIFSELLTYANPQDYVIFNKTTILCYGYLDIPDMPKYNYQYTGKKYAEVCAIAKEIAAELNKSGVQDFDLLAVDYFLWDEILPLAEKKTPETAVVTPAKKSVTNNDSKSLHGEIKEKIVIIGKLLGFESQAEVKISSDSIVDAIWESKIGNMGKVIYVFEVQSKGSISNMLINLKKAQSNAAVQAVVAVSDEEQLSKVLKKSKNVIAENSLRTWSIDEVLIVHDSLTRAHESINKLALVPERF